MEKTNDLKKVDIKNRMCFYFDDIIKILILNLLYFNFYNILLD